MVKKKSIMISNWRLCKPRRGYMLVAKTNITLYFDLGEVAFS